MNIEIGSLVKVTSEETSYYNKFGNVTEIEDDGDEDGPIGIKFDKEDMIDYMPFDGECVVRFELDELEVVTDMPVEYLAKKLFRYSHHSVYALSYCFSPKNDCMYEDCSHKATKRAVTNIWGSVSERDVCDEHYEMCHGKCGEIFPMSHNYEPVEIVPRTST